MGSAVSVQCQVAMVGCIIGTVTRDKMGEVASFKRSTSVGDRDKIKKRL